MGFFIGRAPALNFSFLFASLRGVALFVTIFLPEKGKKDFHYNRSRNLSIKKVLSLTIKLL
jgi:hypothetical protein